jgi:hypothetical protein
MIHKKITNNQVLNAYKKLAKKIVKEHYNMTLPFDRSFNYLWWMYSKGTKEGDLGDFILFSEMNLLRETDTIHQEGFDNLIKMLSSGDEDNLFIAIKSIESLRNERIKKYGEFPSDVTKASPIMLKLAEEYGSKIMTSHMGYNKKRQSDD